MASKKFQMDFLSMRHFDSWDFYINTMNFFLRIRTFTQFLRQGEYPAWPTIEVNNPALMGMLKDLVVYDNTDKLRLLEMSAKARKLQNFFRVKMGKWYQLLRMIKDLKAKRKKRMELEGVASPTHASISMKKL
jgi:hypothetical protein